MSIGRPPAPEIVKHLVAIGADVNLINIYGNNSLHYAVKLKDVEIIRILLESNVDINQVNNDGVSPLRESILTKPFDHASIQLLIEQGADVNQNTEGGTSILSFAKSVAFDDVVIMELFGH